MARNPIKDAVDIVSRRSGLGGLSNAATNNLWGINHRGIGNPVPTNRDNHGLTFFTRPMLNLSYDNIATNRVLTPLLSGKKSTYQAAIRVLLDPIGANSEFESSLVDNLNPFMPLLSNNLLSMSGWPDIMMDTYSSKPGIQRETWSMADSTSKTYDAFDPQLTFRNIEGDPITLLFSVWIHYMASVYEGSMVPYPEFIIDNEIDYQTRIYRLVLDPSRRYVQKIAACGAAFPLASPVGAAFNFSADQVYNQDSQQINIPFRCIGATYNDPILIEEFNTLVAIQNRNMRDPSANYMRLEQQQLPYFNYRGYPRIDPTTFELEWWVSVQDYNEWLAISKMSAKTQEANQSYSQQLDTLNKNTVE